MKTSSCKVSVAVICILAIFLSLAPLTAMAGTYGIDGIDNLAFLYKGTGNSIADGTLQDGVSLLGEGTGSWGNVFSGTYEATYLGYEAAYTDRLLKPLSDLSSETLFKNQEDNASSIVGDTASFDVGTAWYNVSGRINTAFLVSNLKVYSLSGAYLNSYANMADGSWTSNFVDNNIYYVVGFGDGTGDGDYDDLVIACNTGNTVPIPGAVWLLGSGLLGLIGIRRKKA